MTANHIDPSKAQRNASSPEAHCWVAASAGSGKTKVLTDRLMRLLLDGCDPEKILCLTFTKAAAQEMLNRVQRRLSHWAQLSDVELMAELNELGHDQDTTTNARNLYFKTLDHPLNIQTLHSFCQSLLMRFPLEANIPPTFSVLSEEEAEVLLKKAVDRTLLDPTPQLQQALNDLAPLMGEYSFLGLLSTLSESRISLEEWLERFPSFEAAMDDLADKLGTKRATTLFDDNNILLSELKELCLTQKGEIRKTWMKDPEKLAFAEAVMEATEFKNAQDTFHKTKAFLTLALHALGAFADLKMRQGSLDYDDLLLTTQRLLNNPDAASWVLYKLDYGFEHILVDEAQDTSPLQWSILEALINELFTIDHPERTIFVVGDEKQSIYSFQGARPQGFHFQRQSQGKRIESLRQEWREIVLDVSFRTSQEILDIVDKAVPNPTSHKSYRSGHRGSVKILPITEDEDANAKLIVSVVQDHLNNGLYLPSKNRTLAPQDILILCRKRGRMMHSLVAAFQKANIPIAGPDRLVLQQHIAIKDLVSLGQFLSHPYDDLALAEVLKSPLLNFNEADLFEVATYRSSSTLWHALKDRKPEHHATQWLTSLLNLVDLISVYELYHLILFVYGGAVRLKEQLGNEIQDILELFLEEVSLAKSLSLDQFLTSFTSHPKEIKRDTSVHQNHIRLMTVHGAKGLEAPLVILADATSSPYGKTDMMLWNLDTQGQSLGMILRPPQEQDCAYSRTLKEQNKNSILEEHLRLLYVAMTRAEDHLIITGPKKRTALSPSCWYEIIKNAMPGEIYGSCAFKTPDTSFKTQTIIPDWAQNTVTEFKKTLEDGTSISNSDEARRGILMHRLLEVFPSLSESDRTVYFERTQMANTDLIQLKDKAMIEEILKELGIRKGRSFQELEVYHRGSLIRMDKVLISDTHVEIIDYKTGEPSPSHHQQLKDYHSAITPVFPNHHISLKLIYVESGTIVEVTPRKMV